MSALEDRLRDAFRADAETVRPDTIPRLADPATEPSPPVHRSRARRLLISLAATAAVVLVAVGISAAPALLGGHAHRPGPDRAATVPTAPMPSFYVTARGGPLIVRDRASGKIVGQLKPPPGTSLPVVAAAAGHTFVTAVQSVTRQQCTAQLYRFRLNGLGQPGPLTPLHVTVVGNLNVYGGFAVTPDARTVAMSTGWCDHGIEQVRVINLATGLVKTWTGPVPSGSDLSLSANGRLLLFGDLGNDTRLLRTSAPAGSLIANSRTVSAGMAWGAFVGDGASMYGCTVSPMGQLVRWGAVTYYRYSVATGRKMTLFSWRHLEWPYCAATVDPSRSYLLAQRPMIVPNYAGWQVPYTVNGYNGRITRIPVPASDGPVEIAW